MCLGRSESAAVQDVSSENKNDKSSVARGRSFMKQRKRMGPRMVPCKTDISRFFESEIFPLISTLWVLFDK